MRLPDDAEVSDELWDQVIESMITRAGDKIHGVRTYAIRALSRFVNDIENSDILELFLQTLSSEQNPVSFALVSIFHFLSFSSLNPPSFSIIPYRTFVKPYFYPYHLLTKHQQQSSIALWT